MLARIFARRYLFSAQSRSVVNLIAGLSVVAVAMPVAAMIILMSVFNGFERLAEEVCSAVDAELTITPREGKTFTEGEVALSEIRSSQGVAAAALILDEGVLVEHRGRQATVRLRGVDEDYDKVVPMADYITAGGWEVALGDFDRMVMGRALAMQLGIRTLNNTELATYAVKRGQFSALLPVGNFARRRIDLAGIYTLDLETEEEYVFTSLRYVRSLVRSRDKASAVVVALRPRADITKVQDTLQQVVGKDFKVETRHELRASFYRIMEVEKWGIFLISLLVLVIASFSIVGAVAMQIVEKRKDMATLRALGASQGLIRRIFFDEGMLITAWGTALGAVIGIGAVWGQQTFGWIEIPAESFLVKTYPVEMQGADLVLIGLSIAVVGALLSLITSRNMIKEKL